MVLNRYKFKELYSIDNLLIGSGKLGFLKYSVLGNDIVVTEFGLKFLTRNSYLRFMKLLNFYSLSLNDGYYIELEFEGLGYRFINLLNDLILRVGYSHYVYFKIPRNVLVFGFRKRLVLFSVSKEHLHQLLFLLSRLKKYNCYKKKGVFLKGKVFKMKESKSSSK